MKDHLSVEVDQSEEVNHVHIVFTPVVVNADDLDD